MLRYWFLKRRLPEVGSIFKLPETAGVELLTVDDTEDPNAGLVFEADNIGLVGIATLALDEFARHNEAMWGFDPRFNNREHR